MTKDKDGGATEAPELLTIADAAKAAGLTTQSVQHDLRRGRLSVYARTRGGYRLFLASDVNAWLAWRARRKQDRERARLDPVPPMAGEADGLPEGER